MRRGYRRIWRAVPCTSWKSLRTDSRMDIEEILKTKLSTIKEEPELSDESLTPPRHRIMTKKQSKKIQAKDKTRRFLVPHVSLKQSYVLLFTGFASKGTFGGLLQY
ncbi:Ran GTPase-activating protein [Quillaja saponaria]|uniref:Ran GTPase-activating protein n=1 Tax=Quillaja saponaria TaxID=32244 RepID=A0AAD7Q1N8_QUISA|nr:Ran GTPase-activating protein [Quillaja saponaria]